MILARHENSSNICHEAEMIAELSDTFTLRTVIIWLRMDLKHNKTTHRCINLRKNTT